MSLTGEVFDRIQRLERNAAPIIKAPDYDVTGRFYLRDEAGTLTEAFAERPADEATLYSTESLARLIAEEDARGESVVIYYAPSVITAAVEGDAGERWRHVIHLRHHPAFARLQQLTRTETFTQKTLIRLLRAEFNGHVEDRVIERFRTLNLKTDGSGQTIVAQGRAGVDKRIQQAISDQGGKDIPTEIRVTVPVYDLDESREHLSDVGVLIDVSPDEDGRPEFELTTIVNDLAAARRKALDLLIDSLKESLDEQAIDVPSIFYGAV